MCRLLTQSKSYERKSNYFERFIEENGIHFIEDIIRRILIEQNFKLTKLQEIFVGRIMQGRNINAINENNGQLDMRHLKAQVINVSCLVIHIRKNKNYLTNDLLKLLVHHTAIIREHLKFTDELLIHDYDINHYDYCIEWFKNCIIMLDNKISDKEYIFSKIREIRDFVLTKQKNSIILDNDRLNKSISKISIDNFL